MVNRYCRLWNADFRCKVHQVSCVSSTNFHFQRKNFISHYSSPEVMERLGQWCSLHPKERFCIPRQMLIPKDQKSLLWYHHKTRGKGNKLKHRKFQLKVRKVTWQAEHVIFTLRVTEHWNKLPRGVVESPSLKIFRTHLDTIQCSLL